MVFVKPVFVALVLAFGLLLAGCAQSPPPSGASAAPPSSAQAAPNLSAPVQPPAVQVFQPVHLVYALSMPTGPQRSDSFQIDYYLDEKTTCSGQSAVNGLVKFSDPARPAQGARYSKITLYSDTGEAVYSNDMDGRDIGFDTAKPSISSLTGGLDSAFYISSLMAKGGKNLLSAEVWNSTRPVILKSVGAFGGAGDYSIVQTGSGAEAGLACTNFTLNAKASNFGGQMQSCIHLIPDVNLAVMTGGAYPGGGPSWSLSSITREKGTDAYYPQCLTPIKCPSLSAPGNEDYGRCNAINKTYNTEYDANDCVTAFNCVTFIERARSEMARIQRGGSCPHDEALAQKAADCWASNGNTNFRSEGQSNCIQSVECMMPPPAPNNGQGPNGGPGPS